MPDWESKQILGRRSLSESHVDIDQCNRWLWIRRANGRTVIREQTRPYIVDGRQIFGLICGPGESENGGRSRHRIRASGQRLRGLDWIEDNMVNPNRTALMSKRKMREISKFGPQCKQSLLRLALGLSLVISLASELANGEHALSEVWSEGDGVQLKYLTNHDDILSNRGSELSLTRASEQSKPTTNGGQESAEQEALTKETEADAAELPEKQSEARGGAQTTDSGSAGSVRASGNESDADSAEQGSEQASVGESGAQQGGADAEAVDSGSDSEEGADSSQRNNRVPLKATGRLAAANQPSEEPVSKSEESSEASRPRNRYPESEEVSFAQVEAAAEQANLEPGEENNGEPSNDSPAPLASRANLPGRMFGGSSKLGKPAQGDEVSSSEKQTQAQRSGAQVSKVASSEKKYSANRFEEPEAQGEPEFGARPSQKVASSRPTVANSSPRRPASAGAAMPLKKPPQVEANHSNDANDEENELANEDPHMRPPFGRAFLSSALLPSKAGVQTKMGAKPSGYLRNILTRTESTGPVGLAGTVLVNSPDNVRDEFISPGHFPGSMAHLNQAASETQRDEQQVYGAEPSPASDSSQQLKLMASDNQKSEPQQQQPNLAPQVTPEPETQPEMQQIMAPTLLFTTTMAPLPTTNGTSPATNPKRFKFIKKYNK